MFTTAMKTAAAALVFLFCLQASSAQLLTYYCPASSDPFEGGSKTMFGNRVITLEKSSVIGHLPTAASWLNFAGKCNNYYRSNPKNPRCVLRITIPGMRKLPGYKAHVKRFQNKYKFLCDDCDSIAVVMEDTGGPFNRQNKRNPKLMFDLAVDSSKLCRSGAGFRTDKVSWDIVDYVDGKSRPK